MHLSSAERAIAVVQFSWPFARTQGVCAAVLRREDEKIVGLIDSVGAFSSECVFTTILFGCENQFADLAPLDLLLPVARRPVEQHCIGGKQQ